ncbi:1,4-dihydroxy-6-naphthoate synthase [Desulfospira joergensenii]|uniref:1,4-dihydroxy-6-naphthoate synthase n=1 Tax=Desulfospira joergensenii TaxID=53329 RepID=UPI0003B42813|nr:1,4-dihydroxy-6-naphthoate synthase [Desulfospira joergensenii]
MKNIDPYSLAFSSCPNDTFIFKAIAGSFIDLKKMSFHISMEDVETLNQNAAKGKYDITKLSFAALGSLLEKYGLLRTGSALGRGCGPLIISLPGRSLDGEGKQKIAVPGLGTTGFHLFRFYLNDQFPGVDPQILPMPFEKIMPAVMEGSADFGVIIHEGRFVYQTMGLEMKADLGQWWEDQTGLPIPLGCIAVRRELGEAFARKMESLIRDSIDHAFAHPDMGKDYIQAHAQEMDEAVIQEHIKLYVNQYSRDIGSAGEQAVIRFFDTAVKAGLMEKPRFSLFAC